MSFINISDSELSLADLIVNGSWDVSILNTVIPPPLEFQLLQVVPSLVSSIDDHWVWKFSRQGLYTARDAYSWLCSSTGQVPQPGSWTWIWKVRAQKKVRVFIWFIAHDILQVNTHRYRCRLASSLGCTRCNHLVEDCMHCLRDRPFSRAVWTLLNAWTWPHFMIAGAWEWVRVQVFGSHSSLFVGALWGLWR